MRKKMTEGSQEEQCFLKYGNTTFDSFDCPPAWDGLHCWPPTERGHKIVLRCDELFSVLKNSAGRLAFARRSCNENGDWDQNGWTNYTECLNLDIEVEEQNAVASVIVISYLIIIVSFMSLAALSGSLFIFCTFKSLHCSRIRVHRNLIVSLMLHALMMIVISVCALHPSVMKTFQTSWLCNVVLSLKMYSASACILWMFVEGLVLHSSITVSVFKPLPFLGNYIIGWGIPIIFVASWTIAMSLYGDIICWKGYGRSPYVWLITGPMIVALLVNTVFLVNIIRILVTKMRKSSAIEIKQVKKATKATALLLPLLGITHLLFCINPGGDTEFVYMIINAFLQSSQGLFVSILYCFMNSEVQATLGTAWTRRNTIRRDRARSRAFGSSVCTTLSRTHEEQELEAKT